MRLPIRLIALCLLVAAAAPAFAAAQKDHDDCNSTDVERNIAGCTRVAEDTSESDKVRAIAYVGRALALDRKGERDRAMADLTAAIRLNPNDSLAFSDRGILWRETGDVDRAIADFTEALRLSPLPHSDLAGPGHVNVYANRALAWWAKGDLDHALADFDAALAQDPKDVEARYHRAQIRMARRDLVDAVADLDAVIALDPAIADAHYLRGAAHYDLYMYARPWLDPRDLDLAIADFSDVIARNPTRAAAYFARGLAYTIAADHPRAIADLTRAVELNPVDTDAVAALKALKPDYQPPRNPVADWADQTPKGEK
ncbi:MAG: tetratricopeptide repeat protein [Xanthobacteraceae bacterium]|nr:tetratricopeptide repeat protein [Xanthobacteraceae bacterium]